MKTKSFDITTWTSGIEVTDKPLKNVTNLWLTAIDWCVEHNHEYVKSWQHNDGMGHCDSTIEETIVIKSAFGDDIIVISRAKESLSSTAYAYKECVKLLDQYRIDEYKEDSKKITSCKMALEKHAATLFKWGYNTDMTETKANVKQFNLE